MQYIKLIKSYRTKSSHYATFSQKSLGILSKLLTLKINLLKRRHFWTDCVLPKESRFFRGSLASGAGLWFEGFGGRGFE